jgi:polyisoprenyl-teichoic acid--peptidoglycan teichoic acid transferase
MSYDRNDSDRYSQRRSRGDSKNRNGRNDDMSDDRSYRPSDHDRSNRDRSSHPDAYRSLDNSRRDYSSGSSVYRSSRGSQGSPSGSRQDRPDSRTHRKQPDESRYSGSQLARVPDDKNLYSRKSTQDYTRGRKRKKSKKKIVIIILAIVAVLLFGAAGAVWAFVNNVNSQLHSGFTSDELTQLQDALADNNTASGQPFYMLLMGTDRRSYEGETQDRSDSMILVRIDPQNKQAVMVSIHRDIPVLYNGSYVKMNALHYYGGAALAVKGVSTFAGVDISHYAEINFDNFAQLIDDIGGIQIDVPEHVDATDTDGVPLYNRDGSPASDIEKGLQTLNGDQALTFCRSRTDYNGDQQRAANQRVVLEAVANKILNLPYNQMLGYVNEIASCVSTDMTIDQILTLAKQLQGMTTNSIYSYMVPTEGFYDTTGSTYGIARCWWEKVYDDDWKAMIAAINAGQVPSSQSAFYTGNIADEYKNSS